MFSKAISDTQMILLQKPELIGSSNATERHGTHIPLAVDSFPQPDIP